MVKPAEMRQLLIDSEAGSSHAYEESLSLVAPSCRHIDVLALHCLGFGRSVAMASSMGSATIAGGPDVHPGWPQHFGRGAVQLGKMEKMGNSRRRLSWWR